ncbi:hypothetical protein K0T92_23585 [Paenibacillus oenotherae]|uniref:Uncharacterized protein n=1 Tax=Paenibacillus oenotherae TaxID=1435645 RepID=A0ABS7DCU3_9BACL|nr:hypothetical protein [Paenibacillus oenotherae]MBW7477700.1 hypothetical protein [Paenibacillus oenotherae]
MWDVWGALITPSIGFSGFVGAIIIAVVTTVYKVKNNPFRFFISLEETQYMSGWARLFRTIYLSIVITIGVSLYAIYITTIDHEYKYAWAHKAMVAWINPISMLVALSVLIFIIVLLCWESAQKKLSKKLHSQSVTKRQRSMFIIIIMIFILVYGLFFSALYGVIVNECLIKANQRNIEYSHSFQMLFKIHLLDSLIIGQIIALTILYYIALIPTIKVSKFLGRSELIVNIFLKSGKSFEGKYVLNSNVDDGILICDSLNIFDQNKHLIPKMNIDYVSFKTTYYSLGKEVVQSSISPLVTLSQTNDDEKALLKSILRAKDKENR